MYTRKPFLIILCLVIPFLFRTHALAEPYTTYTVNSTADTDDGVCDTSNCTLREAINASNASPGQDWIMFSLSAPGNIVINSGTELPVITGEVVIDGPGISNPIYGFHCRIFEIGATGKVTIYSMELVQGGGSGAHVSDGGAIYNLGDLVLYGVIFLMNNADTNGGAVYNAGTLDVFFSWFSFNTLATSPSYGAAIYNAGTLMIQGSHFDHNDNSEVRGGAIYNAGSLNILDSHFSTNTAKLGGAIYTASGAIITTSLFNANSADYGGAIYNNASTEITNSTMTANTASGGGAIRNDNQPLVLTNVTISGNDPLATGMALYGSVEQITLRNSIVSGNNDKNCQGAVIDGGGNLQYPGTDCGATIPSQDPLLQALSQNGGYSETMELSWGSPAIDAGLNLYCPTTDQRNYFRPMDGDLDGTKLCDAGAYELQVLSRFMPLIRK